MADADVQLQPDGSGKLVDTGTVTTSAGTVHRQRITIGDPGTGAAVSAVKNTDAAAADYGLIVRPIGKNWVQQVNLNPSNVLPLASANFDSTPIDLGDLSAGAPGFSHWRVLINIDQSGTLNMQQSPDSSTWNATIQGQAITSGVAFVYESMIVMRYLRVHYVNGGTGLGTFVLRAYLVAV